MCMKDGYSNVTSLLSDEAMKKHGAKTFALIATEEESGKAGDLSLHSEPRGEHQKRLPTIHHPVKDGRRVGASKAVLHAHPQGS